MTANRFQTRSVLVLAAIFLVCWLCSGTAASGESAERLSAVFRMERSLAVLQDKLVSSGRLFLGGPGLLRWETEKPARSVLVVNREAAEIRYPDLAVVKRFDLSDDPVMRVLSEHLAAITSGDLVKASAFYKIEPIEGGRKRLVPKQAETRAIFREIRIAWDSKGAVSEVALISPGGDITVISFSDVRVDPRLPPETFQIGR